MRHTFQSGAPTLLYRFVRGCARWLWFGLLGGVRAVNPERVPETGPVLLCPNHVSNADPPAAAVCLQRPMNAMGKEELFRIPIFGWVIRAVGCFPVKRGVGDSEAIRYALDVLGRGAMLLIFPEGTRNDGKTMRPISTGVAMMAKRSGAKVVPAAIVGTHIQFPRNRIFPRRARVTVAFGEPFTYAEVATGGNERENRERFSAELARRIAALATEHGMPLTIAQATSDEDESLSRETATAPTGPGAGESPSQR